MVKDKNRVIQDYSCSNDLGVNKTYLLIYYCLSCEKDIEIEVSSTIIYNDNDLEKGVVDCSMEYILKKAQLHKETPIHECCEDERGVTRIVGIRNQ